MRRTKFSGEAAIVLAFAALLAPASAQPQEARPVVVEMFLSQACKQSPPAAVEAAQLSLRPDIVVLSWHVDYWNLVNNKKHGRWKDPFSSASFASRQRIYNRKIRDRTTVFTPQAIISGAGSTIGSKAESIEEIIDLARPLQKAADFSFTKKDNVLTVTIDMDSSAYNDVILVNFRKQAVTEIKGGDNFGRIFQEANVVTGTTRLGTIAHREERFTVPAPAEGMGCAVLVQERQQGAIIAAHYCQ